MGASRGIGNGLRPTGAHHGSVTFPCVGWLGCRTAQRREHDRQTSPPAAAAKKRRACPRSGPHNLGTTARSAFAGNTANRSRVGRSSTPLSRCDQAERAATWRYYRHCVPPADHPAIRRAYRSSTCPVMPGYREPSITGGYPSWPGGRNRASDASVRLLRDLGRLSGGPRRRPGRPGRAGRGEGLPRAVRGDRSSNRRALFDGGDVFSGERPVQDAGGCPCSMT